MDKPSNSEINKHPRPTGVFVSVIAATMKLTACIVALACLFVGFLIYDDVTAYGTARFDQAKWLATLPGRQSNNDRCGMAGTVVTEILKPGMLRSEVENLLGVGRDYSEEDSIEEHTYLLGMCRIVMDDDFLVIQYDKNDKLIEANNEQR